MRLKPDLLPFPLRYSCSRTSGWSPPERSPKQSEIVQLEKQCLPLRIALSQTKSYNNNNNNRMIQLTNAFCVLFRYNGPVVSEYNKRLIILSGGHCNWIFGI